MAVLQLIHPVRFNGKPEYHIEADFMPMPDGTGLVFKATNLLDSDGRLKATLIPWLNIVSMTTDVPAAFFEQPAPDDES